MLTPLGFATDFFFASRFFIFTNSGATLRIPAPALGGNVPVEEYVFYLAGFLAVLLLYIRLDEFWLTAYSIAADRRVTTTMGRLLRFHPESLVLGTVLVIVSILYKKLFSACPEGFPGYFTFLVAVALVPSSALFPVARPWINWRAFSLTLFFILLVSLLWEATLAVPYGWWEYQPRQMMGLSIGAWSGLPIEAVGVWIAVSYATVIIFEVVKLWLASGKSARSTFLG